MGRIQIDVTGNDGAALSEFELRIDGAVVPSRPMPQVIEGGPHRIVMSAAGMTPVSREVTVFPGQTLTVNEQLLRALGTLRVEVRNPLGPPPAGARMTLDGVAVSGMVLNQPIAPGTHHLAVAAEGFRPLARDVLVVAEQTASIELTLEPYTGSVRVVTHTVGAEVFLDNLRIDGSPAVRPNVTAGVHGLRITAPGRTPRISEVNVAPGREALVDVPDLEAGDGAAVCTGGRHRLTDVGANAPCCWDGQVWSGNQCRGVPRCPRGMDLHGEVCEAHCTEGRRAADDGVTCCWPGQGVVGGVCRGVPRCPNDKVLVGESCVADRGPGFFPNAFDGIFGAAFSTSVSGPDGESFDRLLLTFGFMPGPVEFVLTGGYAFGRLDRRDVSQVSAALSIGADVISLPRADHNAFSPLNLSLGAHAAFTLLPDRTHPDTPQFQGGLGFYIAETFFITCGFGVRVQYENPLFTEVLPSTMTFSILGAARSVCASEASATASRAAARGGE